MSVRVFLAALRRAFVTPTTKQQQAYGRLLHNLTAACLIADSSILFTDNPYGARQVIALLVIGVVSFSWARYCAKGTQMEMLKILGVVLFFVAFAAWGGWVALRARERREAEKRRAGHQPPLPEV